MEWNWCAARGPAAITHPIHFINKEKSNKFNFSSLIHELFVFLASPSFHLLSQFDHSFFILKWKAKETKDIPLGRLVFFFAEHYGGEPPITHRQEKPNGPTPFPFLSAWTAAQFFAGLFSWGRSPFISTNSQSIFPFSKRRLMELVKWIGPAKAINPLIHSKIKIKFYFFIAFVAWFL